MNKKILSFILLVILIIPVSAKEEIIYNENSVDIQAVETTQESKYPDYSKLFAGDDKHEKFNRKMFNLNMKLNKFVAKPVHIIWSSIMPKYGIDRIRDAYNNIEYPKRLASCILQKDGQGVKTETLRFLTNTTIGLGGLFDPADKIFKIKPTSENMEQALCKCKMNSGSYLVMPVLHSCTPRSLCGRALEAALDPAVYLASPLTSLIKFGLVLNKTSYMQPLAEMIETTYADPYDIHKKLFGMENYIKNANMDRQDFLKKKAISMPTDNSNNVIPIKEAFITGEAANIEDKELRDILPLGNDSLKADIILADYNPQSPVVDSLRTALFENASVDKSIWNEISLWNRSFRRRIKTGSVEITENRTPYEFKYILQKDKTAPLIILYPSIGEGAGAHHSIIFGKMFYDKGYSILMQGSHFQWEFVKSMPEGYAPGLPDRDAEKIQLITTKALEYLNKKYNYSPNEKYVIGTSFGAMATMFLADLQNKNNTLDITKFIAISPPIELKYALEQADKNAEEFDKSPNEIKEKTALTAAKILQLLNIKDEKNFKIDSLPFSENEGKLITSFFMRQKLSDLIFTIENVPKNQKAEIYKMINNMNYKDYAEKYLTKEGYEGSSYEDISKNANLFALSAYMQNNDNYKIYHSLDDYFVNKEQISRLKEIAGTNLTCLDCGSHLGFLYRKEFEDELQKQIINN